MQFIYDDNELIQKYFPLESPRIGQIECIKSIIKAFESGKRVVILEAPTGSGKSVIAKTIANMADSSCYITSQILLQEQLVSDFGEEGKFQKGPPLVHLKGRSNYPCVYHEIAQISQKEKEKLQKLNMNCATGVCKRENTSMCTACVGYEVNKYTGENEKSLLKNKCPYWLRTGQFLAADAGLMNFKSFLFQTAYNKHFEGYDKELLIIDECFHPYTHIETDLGRIAIGNIVNNKIKCNVLSYNFKNKSLEWKPIVRWLKNSKKQTYKVLVGNKVLYPTENHKIFTQYGKKKLCELQVGDLVYINEPEISETQKQVVLGSLLGDANIHIVKSKRISSKYINKGTRARIKFQHGPRQFKYIDFKYTILKEHVGTAPKITKNNGFGKVLKKFSTKCNFYESCKSVINNNKKSPNINWLNQITELGLAVWYMDDGSISNSSARFHTEGFSIKENKLLCKWLKNKFDIECKISHYIKNNHKLYYISLSRNGTRQLAKLISKYIPKFMRYKLPQGEFDKFDESILNLRSNSLSLQPIKLIEKFKISTTYDIEVKDNHNYFAGSTLVSNCHNTEKELLDFIALAFDDKLLLKELSIRLPKYNTPQEYATWFQEEKLVEELHAAALIAQAQERFQAAEELDNLSSKVDRFLYSNLDNYVLKLDWESNNKRIELKPIFVRNEAQRLLLNKADFVLMMSATVLSADIMCDSLGINKNDVTFIKLPSSFPIENRKIHYMPAGSMSYKSKDTTLPKMIKIIDEICSLHEGQKGIIHTHNFQIAEAIMSKASPSIKHRLLFQKNFKSRDELLAFHKESADTIIVAPAMHEGVDLKDDLSRFQIICKMPYPNFVDDPQLSARMKLSQGYYDLLTCLKLVQSYGRSIRSETDYAETYILDSDFERLISKCGYLLPDWFKEAIV